MVSQGMYPALMLVVVAMQKTQFEDRLSVGAGVRQRAPVERNATSMHFASNHHASSDMVSSSSPNLPVFLTEKTFEDTPYAHVTV